MRNYHTEPQASQHLISDPGCRGGGDQELEDKVRRGFADSNAGTVAETQKAAREISLYLGEGAVQRGT